VPVGYAQALRELHAADLALDIQHDRVSVAAEGRRAEMVEPVRLARGRDVDCRPPDVEVVNRERLDHGPARGPDDREHELIPRGDMGIEPGLLRQRGDREKWELLVRDGVGDRQVAGRERQIGMNIRAGEQRAALQHLEARSQAAPRRIGPVRPPSCEQHR